MAKGTKGSTGSINGGKAPNIKTKGTIVNPPKTKGRDSVPYQG